LVFKQKTIAFYREEIPKTASGVKSVNFGDKRALSQAKGNLKLNPQKNGIFY